MKRQTVHIADLKAEANKVFRDSDDSYKDQRRAIQSFVDSILMRADQYKGFGYLPADRSKPGNSIGIAFERADGTPHFPDPTRIEFF
jgi:hypothetical protein